MVSLEELGWDVWPKLESFLAEFDGLSIGYPELGRSGYDLTAKLDVWAQAPEARDVTQSIGRYAHVGDVARGYGFFYINEDDEFYADYGPFGGGIVPLGRSMAEAIGTLSTYTPGSFESHVPGDGVYCGIVARAPAVFESREECRDLVRAAVTALDPSPTGAADIVFDLGSVAQIGPSGERLPIPTVTGTDAAADILWDRMASDDEQSMSNDLLCHDHENRTTVVDLSLQEIPYPFIRLKSTTLLPFERCVDIARTGLASWPYRAVQGLNAFFDLSWEITEWMALRLHIEHRRFEHKFDGAMRREGIDRYAAVSAAVREVVLAKGLRGECAVTRHAEVRESIDEVARLLIAEASFHDRMRSIVGESDLPDYLAALRDMQIVGE